MSDQLHLIIIIVFSIYHLKFIILALQRIHHYFIHLKNDIAVIINF